MEENKIKPCPVCGSGASMNASVPTANKGIVWQNLYIMCNDDHGIGCRTDLSLTVDFDCVSNSNELLIATWNILTKNNDTKVSLKEGSG